MRSPGRRKTAPTVNGANRMTTGFNTAPYGNSTLTGRICGNCKRILDAKIARSTDTGYPTAPRRKPGSKLPLGYRNSKIQEEMTVCSARSQDTG